MEAKVWGTIISKNRIETTEIKRPPKQIIDGLLKIKDLSSGVSDILDEWGIPRVIPATILKPNFAGAKIVGPAITMQNLPPEAGLESSLKRAQEHEVFPREPNLWNIAKPGDVAVIESGGIDISSMGGLSATRSRKAGVVGAIVDGSVRDVETHLEMRYPIWCRGFSPITSKWRFEATELNGEVRIVNVRVKAGDIVVADMTGTCFVPQERLEELYKRLIELESDEAKLYR